MPLTIKTTTFDEPKICLPIINKDKESIMSTLNYYETLVGWDVVEIRLDFYEEIHNIDSVRELFDSLTHITDRLILATIRTDNEGGEISISQDDYQTLLKELSTMSIDLLDVEYQLCDPAFIKELKKNTHIILSHHNFHKTPDNMEEILEKMNTYHPDFIKLAVMPQTLKDVVKLMSVTLKMSHTLDHPLITMSMSELGKITRISGKMTGSMLTFATAGDASAPGQIPLDEMVDALND